jgi:hypothetical protein
MAQAASLSKFEIAKSDEEWLNLSRSPETRLPSTCRENARLAAIADRCLRHRIRSSPQFPGCDLRENASQRPRRASRQVSGQPHHKADLMQGRFSLRVEGGQNVTEVDCVLGVPIEARQYPGYRFQSALTLIFPLIALYMSSAT